MAIAEAVTNRMRPLSTFVRLAHRRVIKEEREAADVGDMRQIRQEGHESIAAPPRRIAFPGTAFSRPSGRESRSAPSPDMTWASLDIRTEASTTVPAAATPKATSRPETERMDSIASAKGEPDSANTSNLLRRRRPP